MRIHSPQHVVELQYGVGLIEGKIYGWIQGILLIGAVIQAGISKGHFLRI